MVLQVDALDVQVLPADQRLHSAHLQRLQGIIYTEAVLARILANLVEVSANQLLLLDVEVRVEGNSRAVQKVKP